MYDYVKWCFRTLLNPTTFITAFSKNTENNLIDAIIMFNLIVSHASSYEKKLIDITSSMLS